MAKMAAARDRKKEAGWRTHLGAQADSGLSVGAYCRQHGVQAHGFYWWRRELARRDAEQPPAFVPVTVAAAMPEPAPASRVEIVLPGDRQVRVLGPVDKRMLADVLAVLAAREGGVAC
jgi:transposase-like protein